jgi:hypothetical protein
MMTTAINTAELADLKVASVSELEAYAKVSFYRKGTGRLPYFKS